jgi:hypothetical protein
VRGAIGGLLAAAFACGLASGCAGSDTAETPEKPGKLVAKAVSVKATVEAVDQGQRSVLLRREDGTLVALRLGPEVRNLAQVHKGDIVRATYLDSVAVFVAKGKGEPGKTAAATTVELAPIGTKPSAVVTKVTEVTARVQAVDPDERTVTLEGIGTFRVDPSVEGLENVEVGDDVVAKVTEAIAVEVEAP